MDTNPSSDMDTSTVSTNTEPTSIEVSHAANASTPAAASLVGAEELASALALIQQAVHGGERLAIPEAPRKPTVAELIPQLEERLTLATFRVYRPALRRLAAEHPDTPIDELTTDDLDVVVRKVIATASQRVLEEAERTGKPLKSYEPAAHGKSAGENAVRAFAALFTMAERQGLITVHPVRGKLKPPRRDAPPERPLTASELAELHAIWSATGNDPELDGLLFEFHRKTAARRMGAINLRLGTLDPARGSLRVTEKFHKTREMPLDVEFLGRLERFARSRGAEHPADHVFRSKRHKPITRRRYETIYRRHHEMTTWTRIDEVGVHWLRHTTLDDVAEAADIAVAAAYAGHEPASLGPIGLYAKVSYSRLQAVYEKLFGPIFNDGTSDVEVPPLLASAEDVGEKSTGGLCERAAES